MKWQSRPLSDFLVERKRRIKHGDANRLNLPRIRKIDFSGNVYLESVTQTKTDMIRVQNGDLVISGINASKGAIAIFESDKDALATIHYSSYEYDPKHISVDFIKWFFRSSEFIRLLKEQVGGGIKTELKAKHILPLQVRIPTLAEQQQIANRLARISDKHIAAMSEIAHQETLLAQLKQAILHEAIQGKLMADWRQENPAVEPASQLLERIRREKQRLVAKKKIRREKPLPPIAPEEIPFEIPERWAWCRFAEIGILSPRNNESDSKDASFIPMSLIPSEYGKPCAFEVRKWKEISKGYTHFRDGDVGLAKITPCFQNQKSAVFRNLVGGFGAGTTELHMRIKS